MEDNKNYVAAVEKYPLTPEAVEKAAEALALSITGGSWLNRTPEQKAFWMARVRIAMQNEYEPMEFARLQYEEALRQDAPLSHRQAMG